MAIDTPARIAILGAGPSGLEAALYGRFLGYEVVIYERDGVCEGLLQQGDSQLLGPCKLICSRLGLAALLAQDPNWRPPDPEACLTGRQLVDAYYLPLSSSDLLSDSVRAQTEILQIERVASLSDRSAEDAEEEERQGPQFRLVFRDASGHEQIDEAQVLIDATGEGGQRKSHVNASNSGVNLYILGGSSDGRPSTDLLQNALAEIRTIFSILGGRENLDLYRTIQLPELFQDYPAPPPTEACDVNGRTDPS